MIVETPLIQELLAEYGRVLVQGALRGILLGKFAEVPPELAARIRAIQDGSSSGSSPSGPVSARTSTPPGRSSRPDAPRTRPRPRFLRWR